MQQNLFHLGLACRAPTSWHMQIYVPSKLGPHPVTWQVADPMKGLSIFTINNLCCEMRHHSGLKGAGLPLSCQLEYRNDLEEIASPLLLGNVQQL